MVSNWATPDYDIALVLTAATANLSSPYAKHITDFITEYASPGGQVKCAPVPPSVTCISCPCL
jgi:hypothetical protein